MLPLLKQDSEEGFEIMELNCVDCTTKVGTIHDKNVPARCPPCDTKLTLLREGDDLGKRSGAVASRAARSTDRRQL